MDCPKCGERRRAFVDTYHTTTPYSYRPLPKDLRGFNIVRREKKCKVCNTRFFTIEILETAFDAMKKSNSLEETVQKVRKT